MSGEPYSSVDGDTSLQLVGNGGQTPAPDSSSLQQCGDGEMADAPDLESGGSLCVSRVHLGVRLPFTAPHIMDVNPTLLVSASN